MADVLLQVQNAVKHFGGVAANDGVNLEVRKGELHAIIGPNGAGKTTLIAQLSGDTTPDSGRLFFNGHDITNLQPYRRARLGMARSFQITNIFSELTTVQNVALGVQGRSPHSFQFWARADRDSELRTQAFAYLSRVGLGGQAEVVAENLAHGEKRQLEIAMALATDPQLLLLDEPMAGMGPEETMAMVEILASLKMEKTILLVEHDMDAVFALADRISVLVSGQIIATGEPRTIRNDPGVRAAYLGEENSE